MAPTRGGKQPLPDLLLVKEVASRLRVTEQFITNLLRRGEICGYRIGRLWRIDRADLESWLQKQRPRPFRLPIGSWAEKGQIGLSGMVWEAQNAGSDRGATVRLPGNRKNCYLLQR